MIIDTVAGRDRQLVSGVAAGSVHALGELCDRFDARAYQVAFAVCGDDGRAQESVQDAFLAVWRGAGSYTAARGTVGAWLMTVVRHRAIDVARRDGRHARHRASEDELDEMASGDDGPGT